jgi:hypothetical protein
MLFSLLYVVLRADDAVGPWGVVAGAHMCKPTTEQHETSAEPWTVQH